MRKAGRLFAKPGTPAFLASCGKTQFAVKSCCVLTSGVDTYTTRRMLKKAVQQGRSERGGEVYASVH
jgi:hypothetical protein